MRQHVFLLFVAAVFAVVPALAVAPHAAAKHQDPATDRQQALAPAAGLRFRAQQKAELTADGDGSEEAEGTEEPAQEGEEPLTAEEIAKKHAAQEEAIQEQQDEAVNKAEEAEKDFKECVHDCKKTKDEAMAEANDDATTPPQDPNRECCVAWHNYFCFCFAGGCCGGDE